MKHTVTYNFKKKGFFLGKKGGRHLTPIQIEFTIDNSIFPASFIAERIRLEDVEKEDFQKEFEISGDIKPNPPRLIVKFDDFAKCF
ncbi:MAG: hypothetical protein K0S53_413 [Bacteroidetes bacterium]|jgi:ribosome biogenesis SPOUT family RNA methylase Rps3|nr:hypothetical protein [Bacteroidota bacterium]